MRHIILHHHIFKNAGSTLDFTLARQFGTTFGYLENGGEPVHESMLVDFLDANPHIGVVSSHHLYGESFDPVLRNHGYRVFDMALVRRPMQRLLSVYKYLRRTPSTLPLWRQASELEIRDFLHLLIESNPHEIDNPQVNIFANRGFYARPVGEPDLAAAWERYRRYSLCGPVERFDEAMVTVEYFNSPIYLPQGLDLSYQRINVSEALLGENDLDGLLGEDLHASLKKYQEWDERLWALANAELDRRIQLVPNFTTRLANFRMRCQERARAAA